MKVLMVAVFSDTSTNSWQAKGFENIGTEVVRYNYRKRAEKVGLRKRDDEIIDLCRREKPDFTLYSKCNRVNIRVIRECNKIGKTVLWFMDFVTRIDEELRQKMKECNYVFCSRYDGINEAVKYNSNVYRLQGGYDPELHCPIDVPKTKDVVFIGNIERRGRGQFAKNVNFEVVQGIYGKEHSKVVSETKINLNFNEGDGTSNRLYKLLAAKGFVLTQPWTKMEEDWEVGKDFVVFNDPPELNKKIGYYLNRPSDMKIIAQNGYNKVQNYDNKNYARKIIEKVLGI